jgi:hypothetical protein
VRIFDFAFVAAAFVSLFIVISIVVEAWRGRIQNALRIALVFGACLALYIGTIIGVSLAAPQEVLALREERCFDDWCYSVDNVARAESGGIRLYTVSFRLTSRARRVTQRELGLTVYLIDDQGKRYDPLQDNADVPFDVALAPGETRIAVRTYALQGSSGPVRLIITREGIYRLPGLFIIGDESSFFSKPVILLLPE